MSFALLRKELSEHGAVLFVTGLLAAATLLALLVQAERILGGRFVGLVRFSMLFGLLIPFVLANRLLAREYGGRTQLFLETLPIGRARAFATKWLLGCTLTLLAAGLAWLVTLRSIRRIEVLSLNDALGPLLAVSTFWFTAWCFAAMAAMLGRYRYVVWALAVLVFFALADSGIGLNELPLLRLLGSDVQMARELPDPSAFVVALAIALVSLAGAAALALVGSGAMSAALARRMTSRERVFVLVGLTAVATLSSLLERGPELPPFEITEGEKVDGRFANVGVLPTADLGAAAARELALTLADDVDALIDALSLDIRPSIFVLPQRGLDRYTMQRASTSGSEGIVINMAPDAPRDRVRALIGHAVIADATHARAFRDDRHVLLDGLSAYWAVRDDEASRELWRLRAAAVTRSLQAADLTHWAETMERLGECVSLAVAFAVFETLVERIGVHGAVALQRGIFSTPHDDVRVLFERKPGALLAESGIDWGALAEQTQAALERVRERHGAVLAARPSVAARIEQRSRPGRGTEIEVRLDGADRFTVHYERLRPWAGAVGETPRLDARGGRTLLPLSPTRGDRVFVAVEVDDPVLDCPVRVAAERVEII